MPGTLLTLLALSAWLYLVFAHGRFWSSSPELIPARPTNTPDVDVIIPARDEAATIARVVESLLAQDYPGMLRLIVVDDNSVDDTARLAAAQLPASMPARSLHVLSGIAKPDGWSGKLWALNQGIAASRAPFLLFADADIVHDPRHVSTLVTRIDAPRVDMVSEMVHLNCESLAERALVPAFVYFFQLLYPFATVNDPNSPIAAAAGGTVLIRRDALERIGGIAAIRGALIDDVTLAKAVKRGGPVYLGHSSLAASVRPYPQFIDIWRMVSRTAFTQLHYSALALIATLLGLGLVWWTPIAAALAGHGWPQACGITAFLLAAMSYLPTLRRYGRSPLWSLTLPLIALFYMGATLDSAVRHWRGAGARWKNRDYTQTG